MKLQDIFETIADSTADAPIALQDMRLSDVGLTLVAGPVLVGLDTKEQRHLLVPLPVKPEKPRVDDECRGVRVEERPWLEGGVERYYVDVACRVPALNSLFSSVAQEMLDAVRADPNSNAYNTCIKVLGRWRELLGRQPGSKLSEEKLSGIWAELTLLERLAERDPVAALEAWDGPTGGDHDFQLPATAVECKATQIKVGWKVKINGLGQLAPPGGKSLHLLVFRLRRGADGTHVPELVQRVTNKGIDKAELLKLLGELGYHAVDEAAYADYRFAVDEVRFYQVGEGFPSVTARDLTLGRLPDAVQSLKYVVDLGSAEVFLAAEGWDPVMGAFDELY